MTKGLMTYSNFRLYSNTGSLLFLFLLALVIAFLWSGCYGSEDIACTQSKITALANRTEFPGGLSKTEYRGRKTYDHYCQVCHGENGDGRGYNHFSLKRSFGIEPRDFNNPLSGQISHYELSKAIKGGGKSVGKSRFMPPWGNTLSEEQIKEVTTYIRTFFR